MPTGYTAGILDGKITSFPQFAKQCMRAFGATIHMRDESIDKEYEPRIACDYNQKEIKKAIKHLKDSETLSDEKIISNRRKELEKDKTYYENNIKKKKENLKRLNSILQDVRMWTPPTTKHKEIKEFMEDQIVKTIDFDCNIKYDIEQLTKITVGLLSLNATEIRNEIKTQAKKDIEYHTKEQNLEIQRCEEANQWVSDFLKSLPDEQ